MCQISACPAAFQAARKAGRSVARQFPNLWGWSRADFDGEAQSLYVVAVRRWDGRGSLPRYVYQFVRRRLLNRVRSDIRHNPPNVVRVRLSLLADRSNTFDRRLGELSPHAQAAAHMLFDCLWRDGRPGVRPAVIKACVGRTLKVRGWTATKVKAAFGELKGLITCH